MNAQKFWEDALGWMLAEGHAQQHASMDTFSRLQNWKRGFQGVMPRFGVMASPPTMTFGNGSSTVNPNYVNGQTTYPANSPVFRFLGSIYAPTTVEGLPAYIPSHITDSNGNKSGLSAPCRVRFQTDAPAIDFCFLDVLYGQFNLIVDGQFIARDRKITFGNTGNFQYIKCDFGTDVVTYSKASTSTVIVSPGAGHAVGDIITLDGGSGSAIGTPLTIRVGSVSSGAVATFDVMGKGAYTTLPTGTLTQASTTGAGTGFQMQAQFWHKDHTTRRMRQIELIFSDPARFMGVVTSPQDTVLPWVENPWGVKSAFIGDSITIGTYLQYGASHIGCSIAQRLGWWDRHMISGIGGTGWNTVNNPWSGSPRVQDFIDYDADVYWFTGSQNDSAGPDLENSIKTTLNTLLAAKPSAYVIGVGNIMGDSTALANSIGNGFAAADAQSRIAFINNHSPNKWIPSTYLPDWAVTSDNNHLNQSGMDRFADISALQGVQALLSMLPS